MPSTIDPTGSATPTDEAVDLADGSYGFCERCQEQIPAGRLEVLVTSRLCTGCQHVIESGRSAPGRGRSWPL